MLKGLLDTPHINDKTINIFLEKINKNFTIDILSPLPKIVFIHHLDSSVFINPKAIYSILEADYVVKTNDEIKLMVSNQEKTIKISSWEDFSNLCTYLADENLKSVESFKVPTNSEMDCNELMKSLILQAQESLISKLTIQNKIEEMAKVIKNFKTLPQNEQLQLLLENDDPDLFLIKKFVDTYDLMYLMFFSLKHYLKNKPDVFNNIYKKLFN